MNRTARFAKLVPAGLMFLAIGGVLLASGDIPTVGTWKLNVAETQFNSGTMPKSATRTVEAQGDGITVSYEFVQADGSIIKYGYAAAFDSKDSPISGSGGPNWRDEMVGGAESVAIRHAGSNAYGGALKKSGNVVMTFRAVVSKNGKVTTITTNGLDAKGQPVKNVLVWDKQ